jgi:hypothetical protein
MGHFWKFARIHCANIIAYPSVAIFSIDSWVAIQL